MSLWKENKVCQQQLRDCGDGNDGTPIASCQFDIWAPRHHTRPINEETLKRKGPMHQHRLEDITSHNLSLITNISNDFQNDCYFTAVDLIYSESIAAAAGQYPKSFFLSKNRRTLYICEKVSLYSSSILKIKLNFFESTAIDDVDPWRRRQMFLGCMLIRPLSIKLHTISILCVRHSALQRQPVACLLKKEKKKKKISAAERRWISSKGDPYIFPSPFWFVFFYEKNHLERDALDIMSLQFTMTQTAPIFYSLELGFHLMTKLWIFFQVESVLISETNEPTSQVSLFFLWK